MAQVTLYLDDQTAERMKKAARAAGLSRSQWLARLVRQEVDDQWPAAVREMAGAWPDFPLAEELRTDQPPDTRREKL
ncbi:MAG: ribbon-helix-helix protein, CopG family [Vicinamibacteria bacterium]|jgi:hypothetical protein|nr:ribbon-helix-helix protein, CopG family [Vicinamibacteria bacterium]